MKDFSLPEILGRQLQQTDFDLIDVVPLSSNQSVRLQTLEDALKEFNGDEDADGLQQYLVQVRPKRKHVPLTTQFQPEPPKPEKGEIYHADGSLNVPFLMRNAELLQSCGDYALAKNIYFRITRAGQSAIDTSRAFSALAGCLEQENDTEEARNCLEQAIAFQPTFDAYQHLASLLLRLKKDRPAAEVLERALSLKDLGPNTRYELLKAAGNCWTRVNEPAQAEKAYKKALEISPTADEIQANLGTLYLQAGKHAEARRKFQDTLAANPHNDKALTGLGMCLLQEGDKRGAHDFFARALDIELNNSQAVYYLVRCAYELKSYATAARVVENFIQVAPVNIHLLYSLAGLQFHLGRMEEAKSTAEQILQMSPTYSGAKELLQRIEAFSCHGGQDHNGN